MSLCQFLLLLNDNRYLVYRNWLFNCMGDMVCYVYSVAIDRHKREG